MLDLMGAELLILFAFNIPIEKSMDRTEFDKAGQSHPHDLHLGSRMGERQKTGIDSQCRLFASPSREIGS